MSCMGKSGAIGFIGTVIFVILTAARASAQSPASADTAFLLKSKLTASAIYNSALYDQVGLYNGSEHVEHFDYKNPKGFPYYKSDDWTDGNIVYDSGVYTNVPMMYDVLNDKVIVEAPYSHFKLELVSEKVNSFRIFDRDFVRIATFAGDSTFRTGFYEVIYHGPKADAFVHRRKDRQETPHTSGIEVEYLNKDAYFVLRNGVYYRIRKKSSVLTAFADKKKALKKSMRAHRELNFWKRKEASLALVTRLYNELD